MLRLSPRIRLSPRFRSNRLVPLLVAIAPALWCAAPLLWKTPLGIDHPTLIFKAWHFWTEMLGRGRLHGWSQFWAFGSPADELVPLGGEVWVALFRAATLGQLSWLRTYALAFAGFLVFKSLASYWFARSYFGTGAGVICAWIATLDPGEMLQGGWIWHTTYGVWPVTLSMSLALLSFIRLERVLRSGLRRDVFWAGTWFALSVLTHPVSLVAFAITVPLLCADHCVRRRAFRLATLVRVAGALVFGVALAGFYLVPFSTRGDETQDLGWLGYPLPEVGRRLLELRTFDNVWAPVHVLAIVGACFAMVRQRRGSVFFVASAATLVFLASDFLVGYLHLERAFPGLVKIETNRLLLVAKLFWFPLAGHGAMELARLPGRMLVPFTPMVRAAPWAVALLTLTCAALVGPGWRHFYAGQIEKPIEGEAETRYWDDFLAFLAWSRDIDSGGREHPRIAYHMYRGNHLSTLAPVFNGIPIYKVGYTPAQIFNKLPMTDEHELLEALSVKYVMSSYELDDPALVLERRFGELFAYRFANYRPDPFTIEGEGRAELSEFEPERIRIRLSGTTRASRLKIHVASSARWRATISGREVPITTVPVFGVQYPFLMEVPAKDGELLLEYVYRTPDWLGLAFTLTAIPGFFALSWIGRRRSASRLAAELDRWLRANGWVVVAGLVAALGLVFARTRSRARLLPPDSIFQRMEGPELTLGDHSCVRAADLSFECGPLSVRADVVAGVWGIHGCMTVPGVGELRIRTRLPLGSFLAGSYDPEPNREGAIRIGIDGEERAVIPTRPAFLRQQFFALDTRPFHGRAAAIDLSLGGAALRCFDVRVVP